MPGDLMANLPIIDGKVSARGVVLPANCIGEFNCIAEYLEWEAATSPCGWRRFRPAQPNERVYFVGTKDGPVKIGLTNDPATRLQHLQTSSPDELLLLAVVPAGRSLERAYHSCFAGYRIRGEWFERNELMMAEIKYWSAKCRRQH